MDGLDLRLKFAKELALQAGHRLSELYRATNLPIKRKIDRSVLTDADLEIDAFIQGNIHQTFPNDMILSEEGNHPLIDSTITDASLIQYTWVIDPLDGTTNFCMGLPIWGTLLTCMENGFPAITVMYFPEIQELYTAQSQNGAYLNGNQIQVRPPDPNQPFSFFACCSRTIRNYHITVPYKLRITGSSAYTLCLVAKGAAILGFDATPKIWDIAGGYLLITEAGGALLPFDNNPPFPLSVGASYATRNFPLLAGATSEIVRQNIARIISF